MSEWVDNTSYWHTWLHHVFSAALAEFESHFFSFQYFGKANPKADEAILSAAQSEKLSNEICRGLNAVLAHATNARLSRQTALFYQNEYQKPKVCKPQKGACQYHQLSWLTAEPRYQGFWQSSFTCWSTSAGMGFLCSFAPSSGMSVPLKTLVTASPRSLIANLTIDFTEGDNRLTDEDNMQRANK